MSRQLEIARKRLISLRKKLSEQPVPQTLTAARRKIKIMQRIMHIKEKIAQLKKKIA